jgi:hypothetical protein
VVAHLDSFSEKVTRLKENARTETESIGLVGGLRAIRTYLSERFPLVSQGVPLLSGYACCYVLYGQAHGRQVFSWATVVGGITIVLLALVRRIVDDVEDLPDDILAGRASFVDGGRRHLRGLVVGGLAAATLAGVLNATCSPNLLVVSVGVAAWFPLAMVIKNRTIVAGPGPLKFIIVESCPAAVLFYGYVVWSETAGDSLRPIAVVAIAGLFWTTYQFWNFTRKIGTESWPPWRLTLRQTRPALIALLVLAAGFNALVSHYANLHVGYLLYGLTLTVTFGTVILRWWSRLPAREPERIGASWGGLPFPVAVEVGALIGVLAS